MLGLTQSSFSFASVFGSLVMSSDGLLAMNGVGTEIDGE